MAQGIWIHLQKRISYLHLSSLLSAAHDLIQNHLWFQPSYPHPRKGERGGAKWEL